MVKVQAVGDALYAIVGDDEQEVILSENDILSLAQTAQTLRGHILAKHSHGSGATARYVSNVSEVVLNVDLHKSHVYLEVIDEAGLSMAYALPAQVARMLSDRLPARVVELERALSSRKTQ